MTKGGTEPPGLAMRPKPGTAVIPRDDSSTGNFCDIDTNLQYSQLNHVTTKPLLAIRDALTKVRLLPKKTDNGLS